MDEFVITGDMVMHETLFGAADRFGDLEAIVCGPTRVTYAQFGEQVRALAAGVQRLGMVKGEKIVMLLFNSPEFIYFFFGIGAAGGVIVPVNPYFRRREIQHILAETEAEFVVTVPNVMGHDLLALIDELRPDLPHLRHVMVSGAISGSLPPGMNSLESVIESGSELLPVEVTPEDVFGLMYTSGTTGMPKAVIHTQRSMVEPTMLYQQDRLAERQRPPTALIAQMAKLTARYGTRFVKYGQRQRTNMTLTPFHAMAGFGSMRGTPTSGSKLVTMERFHPVRTLELIEKEQVNVLVGTPSMYKLMLQVPDLDKYVKSSLLNCVIGAAHCPPALAREVRQRFNAPITLPFGATETGGGLAQTSVTDSEEQMTETVGQIHDYVETKIVDDERRPLAPGLVGEVAVRKPGLMAGYFKAPELTAEVMDDDGFYYTGDLGVMDENGYLRIVGRRKDVIIRGGQNIYPAEIESYLLAHPDIEDVAVVGVPAEIEGERVWAFVLPREGVSLTSHDVLNHLRGEIAAFKVPSEVRIVSELPRTDTQKVQKFVLRELALNESR